MTFLEAAVLGAVQGLTEFLPISSSGHLLAIPALFGWEAQGLVFDVAVHLATLLAIVIAMRREIGALVKGIRERVRADRSLAVKLLVATIPAVIVGAALGSMMDAVRTLPVVAAMLIAWGILLGIADYVPKKRTIDARRVHDVTWGQAVAVGVAQAFALIPGTSRSGATMTIGLFSGMDRGQAARFSFLLAIPAIVGAGAKTAWDVVDAGATDLAWGMLGIGFASALIFGVIAIRLLFFIIRKTGFGVFALYRIAFGLLLLTVFADRLTA
ncbi:undecaprenyl-diphosphate phosphatase [Candidatus Uhrbacteria bacterium]|nr:undecaprenyl-diphosphate phosphatase [Candidatus Uhrbacteria bacterium]